MRDEPSSRGRPRFARRARFLLEALELFADGGQVALEREDLADARTSRGALGERVVHSQARARRGPGERALPVRVPTTFV